MANTTHTIGSTGVTKTLIDLGDGTYADAVVELSDMTYRASEETIIAGASSLYGKVAAPVNTDYIIVRQKAEPGQDIDWRVKSDVTHTVQLYRARTKPDSMTITLDSAVDNHTATINGVTYTTEDTAGDALRSAHKFYTGGADNTADAVQLAAGINYGAYMTLASVAVGAKVVINGVEFTAAAAADVPNAVFNQGGTDAQDAASLVLCINHKDTATFATDTTAFAATNPATNATDEAYALSIELIADHNTHTALTNVHNQTTAAVSSVAATTAETLVAQVNVSRTAMLAHYADAVAHDTADTVRLAQVAATSACTDATTALALVNLLASYHLAHVATATPTATDTVTVNGLTFTAHAATTTETSRQFSVAGTDSQNGDELVKCINHRATVTVATAVANNSVTINGLTFYGKVGAAVAQDRRFSIDTGNTETAVSLAACINNATYGVPGVTATAALAVVTLIPDYGTTITMSSGAATITCVAAYGVEGITAANASGAVTFTRNSEDYTIELSTAAGGVRPHNPAQTVAAAGVPGVLATSNGAEVDIAPTWADGRDFTVVPSANTITWGRYGIPGVKATSALAVVTVVPFDDTGATVLQSVTGTAAAEWAVAYTTLAGLELDGAAVVDAAANSTTAGKLYEQDMNGWEYGYLQLTNKSGAGVMTATVAATPHY